MLLLPPNIPIHLEGRARRAAAPIHRALDDVSVRDLRKMPGIAGIEPAQKCLVTAGFHRNGTLRRLEAQPVDGDVETREDQFVSKVGIFNRRDSSGRDIEHDLFAFLIEREAKTRFQIGRRELVALDDAQLSELHEARRLDRWDTERFRCAGRVSMALFRRVVRLEIKIRREETSHHQRLAAIASHRADLRKVETELEAERSEALAWYTASAQTSMPYWLNPGSGYDDPTDQIVLYYRSENLRCG